MTTYIFGHLKPDTDSVASTLALADYYQIQSPDTKIIPAILDPLNPETSYIFKTFSLTPPKQISPKNISPEDQVILVDHNEESQRLNGLNPEQIIAIYDHHKLNLNLPKPIEVTVKPWGSTATLIWHLYQEKKLDIKPEIAKLLLSAIISDTVNFKSSTTTEADKRAAKNLSSISQITDLDSWAKDIFKAKSNISHLDDTQVVKNDYKVFEFSKQKVFIGQLETVEQESVIDSRGEALKKAMTSIKQELKLDLIFLAVSDILKVNTKLITIDNSTAVGESAFNLKAVNGILDIGPKLSRKKEIAPAIEKYLSNHE